jgi:O-antigen ligase
MEFFYRGQQRWTGPWDNPNLFGLMMGVGLTLALGLFIQRLTSRGQSRSNADCGLQSAESLPINSQPSAINYFHRLTSLVIRHASLPLLLGAAGLCGYGLLKSYSRGAWLGTALGLGFLVWKFFNHETHQTHENPTRKKLSIFNLQRSTRRLWPPIAVLLISVLVISFWQFRHTESPLARRFFSVGNVNDFSWRNRVAAWEGAGRMMLAKPLVGFGWGKAEEVYSKQYRAAKLEESAAIQLNDYLMLGISAGVPTLGCLLIYLGLVLLRNAECGVWNGGSVAVVGLQASDLRLQTSATVQSLVTRHPSLPTICLAAAIVGMVGFWFDGGLFKLPTAVVFWVLLELARRADIPVCQFGQLSSRPVQEHSAEKHGTGKSHAPAGWKTCPTIALRWLAGIIAVVALGLTALHLITPQRVVSERTLALARKFIVPPKEKADFEFLAAKPIWSGQPLKHLLQHAHLANYNRTLVNWKLDDQLYREFVLSLEIDPSPGLTVTLSPSDGERAGVRGNGVLNAQPSTIHHQPSTDFGWRRPLWEFFYPRIRKESSLDAAAEIVIRNLRERMKMTVRDGVGKSLLQNWQQGQASEREFQVLGVAVLRSVGIPARLSGAAQAEFWNGAEWKQAAPTAAGDLRPGTGSARKD